MWNRRAAAAHGSAAKSALRSAASACRNRARRRFQPAFLHVGGSVYDLQIRHTPIDQHCRPGSLCPLAAAPDLEQRHAVIDFRVLGEPRAGESATIVLQTPQMPNVIARRCPQLPGRDAASVPARIAIGTLVAPRIAMPSEPEHQLPAHAAIAGSLGVRFFAKRRRRRAKAVRRIRRYFPGPAFRRAAQRRMRAGELVGPDRMMAPIRFDGAARSRWNERAGARMQQHGSRKNLRQIALQTSERLGVSLRAPCGLGHVDSRLAILRPKILLKRCHTESWVRANLWPVGASTIRLSDVPTASAAAGTGVSPRMGTRFKYRRRATGERPRSRAAEKRDEFSRRIASAMDFVPSFFRTAIAVLLWNPEWRGYLDRPASGGPGAGYLQMTTIEWQPKNSRLATSAVKEANGEANRKLGYTPTGGAPPGAPVARRAGSHSGVERPGRLSLA